MRWIRTAATTVTALSAALAVVWAALWYLVSPRVVEWGEDIVARATADLISDHERTAQNLERLDRVVAKLEENVTILGDAVSGSSMPSWRFSMPDTSISDGTIGDRVTITAAGYKLRECGVPRVDLYFINGGGIYHRFTEASLLSADNRGVAFPVAPSRIQTVSYTAKIPGDDNVRPGRARGFIAITYPDTCPAVEEVVSGPLQFRIFREDTGQ